MKGKLPLYIGIIGLIIFICIMSMMYCSVKFTIYWVIVPMILLVLANILFRYLNDLLASIIMALAIVIAFHLVVLNFIKNKVLIRFGEYHMFLPIILSIILIIALLFSIRVVMMKRRKAKITGVKRLLSFICLYSIAITNLFAYWFNLLGIISWTLTMFLLILGAYFTKYIPIVENDHS